MITPHDRILNPKLWYVHSGCTNHVCPTRSSFSSFEEDFVSIVRFSDGSSVRAQGKGSINVITKEGYLGTITNVLYVPNLNFNALSVAHLTEKGYGVSMGRGKCEIDDSASNTIAHCQKGADNLFALELEIIDFGLTDQTRDFLF